jgi:hypothetical protein
MLRFSLIPVVAMVAGCASQQGFNYTRVDGRPVDAAQGEAALAQCKGTQAVYSLYDQPGDGAIPWIFNTATKPMRQQQILDACMANAGYITAQR